MFWHYCKLCRIPSAYLICNTCLNEIKQLPLSKCNICFKPKQNANDSCIGCNSHPIYFDQIYSQFDYANPLRLILHEFKYKPKSQYAWFLSYLLNLNLAEISVKPDLIIPMPLHKSRYKERGFNQAERLLDFYRTRSGCATISNSSIIRVKNTEHQTLSNYLLRKQNLADAFQLNKSVTGLNILIIDDVVTTGSTVNELAHLLKQNGALRVDVCCLMRAI